MMVYWAARRYLMARYNELCGQYAALPNKGRAWDGYRYSRDAKRIFPRYNVVEAILEEVERLDPDRLPDVQALAGRLVQAAENAQSPFTQPTFGKAEAEAIADERRLFVAAVRDWMSRPDLEVAPVGYRRVLTPAESSHWRTEVHRRWRVEGTSWHPMLAAPVPDDVLLLVADSMDDDGVDRVRGALLEAGRRRVVELREGEADCLLDVELFTPWYTGAEGVWTDEQLDWIAFASHEGTVAFGGLLADALVTAWPDIDTRRWPGW